MVVKQHGATELAGVVDKIFVVNLESRPDRRKEMLAEFARIGLSAQDPIIKIFRAVRPEEEGPFPSIGARGCFLSQLGVLREARDHGYRAILLLEDDASFTAEFIAQQAGLMRELQTTDWSIAYLGHRIAAAHMPAADTDGAGRWHALQPGVSVECAHAVLFHHRTFAPLVAYLERMMARPAGHPEGGPMHVDGAYGWFRKDHPELLTLVSGSEYVVQRASRSDIAQLSWKENIPFLGVLRALKNRIGRKM